MKATFEYLNDVFIDRYTLSKTIDNTFVKSQIQTDLNFFGDDHSYLFGERLAGSDKEIGTLTHECEANTFEKNVFISHNEGTFDLKRCVTTKKLNFGNPLDCLIGVNKVNIFDYPAGQTNSVQGNLVREIVTIEKLLLLGEQNTPYTLDQIITELGGISDRTLEGFSIEYVSANCVPKFTISLSGAVYYGHLCTIQISYVGLFSTIKYDENWIDGLTAGNYWFNPSLFPIYEWGQGNTKLVTAFNGVVTKNYIETIWEKGKLEIFKNVPISNTIDLSEVLIGLFSCTGMTLVSNFLNINSDASNPANKYYDFASSYCQNVKIVQSYDIIRESALEDSFGKSGFLTGKDILTDISLFFNMMIVPDFTLNIVRWEHVSYFQTKGYDLTSRTDVDLSPLESEKELIDSELFLMAQPTSDEFYKVKIKYNTPDLYKEENEQKYQVKKFLTDVFTTLNNEKFQASEYEPLFFLLSTDGENIISLNNQFSINSIFRNLHDLNRPYKQGEIGETNIVFSGFSIGLEAEIKFLSSVLTWDNIYPLMSVKTKFGTFIVDSVEANEKGLITLKVKK